MLESTGRLWGALVTPYRGKRGGGFEPHSSSPPLSLSLSLPFPFPLSPLSLSPSSFPSPSLALSVAIWASTSCRRTVVRSTRSFEFCCIGHAANLTSDCQKR